MGCRILFDADQKLACLYCSTTDVAFGPIFYEGPAVGEPTAQERATAFLRWLESPACPWGSFDKFPLGDRRHDPRTLTDVGLELAYSTWLAQEADQAAREAAAEVQP
jgi:hypothetical protein